MRIPKINYLPALLMKFIYIQETQGDYAVTGSITNIYILSTLALFILIMAGVNFTNLSLAYSSKRMKEFGLRKIIGANKNMLIRQFLSESVLMVLFSLLLAFVIVNTFLPWFNQIVNRELFFKQIFNIEFLTFILGVSLILGLLSGIYPGPCNCTFQFQIWHWQ